MWHTPWEGNISKHPHVLTIDLGETFELKGFTYLPRTDGKLAGVCQAYRFEVSADGQEWKTGKEGSFDNIRNNPVLQEVFFDKRISAKFIRFSSFSTVNNDPFLSVAEIGIITK